MWFNLVQDAVHRHAEYLGLTEHETESKFASAYSAFLGPVAILSRLTGGIPRGAASPAVSKGERGEHMMGGQPMLEFCFFLSHSHMGSSSKNGTEPLPQDGGSFNNCFHRFSEIPSTAQKAFVGGGGCAILRRNQRIFKQRHGHIVVRDNHWSGQTQIDRKQMNVYTFPESV